MLVFLKLGGSLITDKSKPHTPRRRLMRRLFVEIHSALETVPSLKILLGHGSGSFGHVPASKYGTLQGVRTPEEWRGFSYVWQEAHALNQIVMEELVLAGLPAVAFAPSSCILTRDRKIQNWDLAPLQAAISSGILPVVFGDAVFDSSLGGTILSTEDLFVFLAPRLQPARILLAGEEPGVWADFRRKDRIHPEITPASLEQSIQKPEESQHMDVTGGMRQKVEMMTALVRGNPEISVSIFSGLRPGILTSTLAGATPGTMIRADEESVK